MLPMFDPDEAERYIDERYAEAMADRDADMCSISAMLGTLWSRVFALTSTHTPARQMAHPSMLTRSRVPVVGPTWTPRPFPIN